MSHHSSGSDQEISEETMKQFAKAGMKAQERINKQLYGATIETIKKQLSSSLGPTGKFPHGHLTEQDEGEIAFAVFNKDDKVVIDFSHLVHWLGMTKEQADELGRLLIKQAEEIKS